MGREWLVVLLMVAVSSMTSGCISEQQKFYYSIEDSIDEANSLSIISVLFDSVISKLI